MNYGDNRMSKDYRKTSKLAVAGMILAVAAPCLIILNILADNGLNNFFNDILNVLMNAAVAFPFIALLLSIAGVVVALKKDKKGLIPGTIGIFLSIAEIIFFITIISDFLTRMQNFNPFV
jgi:ABC-type methionine transport system permease subunit